MCHDFIVYNAGKFHYKHWGTYVQQIDVLATLDRCNENNLAKSIFLPFSVMYSIILCSVGAYKVFNVFLLY